jgi:heat-inducible transcriptional repressor
VSRLAAEQDAFATTATTARLLEMLEEQVVVVSLVRDLLDHGVNVSIGSENDVDELRDCSIVLAPYQVEGALAGTVGVLGPTRMDYAQALAAVAAVSQQLGRLLLPSAS